MGSAKPHDYKARYDGLLHILKQLADYLRDVRSNRLTVREVHDRREALIRRIDEEVASNKEE